MLIGIKFYSIINNFKLGGTRHSNFTTNENKKLRGQKKQKGYLKSKRRNKAMMSGGLNMNRLVQARHAAISHKRRSAGIGADLFKPKVCFLFSFDK